MLGCYRRDEAADPEIFTRATIAVLAEYPHWCVIAVTDPAKGVPSRLKWLPSIAELKEACEAQVGHLRRAREREERLAESRRLLAGPVCDEAERKRIVQLAAQYRRARGG
jgi:hypothetical protein